MKFGNYLLIIISFLFLAARCEKEVVSPEVDQPTNTGYFTLILNSNPKGALVYIDTLNSGYKTPCTIKWVEKKSHTITFKLPLFMDGKIGVGESYSQVNLNYDFYSDGRNYGSIGCSTTPQGADIYLNEKPTGFKTPASIGSLRPGNFKISYTRPGCRADSISLTVKAQNSSSAFIELVDTSKFVEYSRETGSSYGNTVIVDSKNRIWYGSAYNGVYIYSGNQFTAINRNNSLLPSNMVNLIFEDSKGTMWISTSSGVAKISAAGEWEILTSANSKLPVNTLNGVCEDRDGNIWLATNKALIKYKDGNWDFYTTSNSGILGNDITTVACAPDNSIWAACYNLGISKFQNGQWQSYTPANSSMTSKYIYWFRFSQDNTVYAVGNDAGFKTTGGNWEKLSYAGWNTTSFYYGMENTIWISDSWNLVSVLSNGTKSGYSFYSDKYLAGVTIKAIAQDKNKNIWLATYKFGLMKYKYYQ